MKLSSMKIASMKIAFLFAGQGAQTVGMGKALYDAIPEARLVFDEADVHTGGRVTRLCFQGSQAELDDTRGAAPCLLTVDVAAARALMARGIAPSACAGFSLGEFAALTVSGALSFADALKLVIARAERMHEISQTAPGGMAALIGKDAAFVEALCAESEGVEAVNYNCPGQTVVAGEVGALQALMEKFEAQGGRAVRLATSGAFHSRQMLPVSAVLASAWQRVRLQPPAVPVYSNVTAEPMAQADIAALSARQVASPVRWHETISHLCRDGMEAFVELGPGGVLAGFLKRIDRKLPCERVEDIETLEAAVARYRE